MPSVVETPIYVIVSKPFLLLHLPGGQSPYVHMHTLRREIKYLFWYAIPTLKLQMIFHHFISYRRGDLVYTVIGVQVEGQFIYSNAMKEPWQAVFRRVVDLPGKVEMLFLRFKLSVKSCCKDDRLD